uniref:Uncharacterized protein n=1 Tax=Streptomyces fradiae TaxID=1906 RepID=Q4A4C7_STRFR|nr:hypothetical protein [Streptomyces fradiae ATCC 10745 = DSM 40063]
MLPDDLRVPGGDVPPARRRAGTRRHRPAPRQQPVHQGVGRRRGQRREARQVAALAEGRHRHTELDGLRRGEVVGLVEHGRQQEQRRAAEDPLPVRTDVVGVQHLDAPPRPLVRAHQLAGLPAPARPRGEDDPQGHPGPGEPAQAALRVHRVDLAELEHHRPGRVAQVLRRHVVGGPGDHRPAREAARPGPLAQEHLAHRPLGVRAPRRAALRDRSPRQRGYPRVHGAGRRRRQVGREPADVMPDADRPGVQRGQPPPCRALEQVALHQREDRVHPVPLHTRGQRVQVGALRGPVELRLGARLAQGARQVPQGGLHTAPRRRVEALVVDLEQGPPGRRLSHGAPPAGRRGPSPRRPAPPGRRRRSAGPAPTASTACSRSSPPAG